MSQFDYQVIQEVLVDNFGELQQTTGPHFDGRSKNDCTNSSDLTGHGRRSLISNDLKNKTNNQVGVCFDFKLESVRMNLFNTDVDFVSLNFYFKKIFVYFELDFGGNFCQFTIYF